MAWSASNPAGATKIKDSESTRRRYLHRALVLCHLDEDDTGGYGSDAHGFSDVQRLL